MENQQDDFDTKIEDTYYSTIQQIECSQNEISDLIDECNEMVTNIRIANDLREINRRKEKKTLEKERKTYLKLEDEKAEQHLHEINIRWEPITKLNDSIDIYNASEEQRKKCELLIENRNNIIETLSKNLANEDERFANDQITQRNDINILAYRIDKQMELLRNMYRKHLQIIEDIIISERKNILDGYQKEWGQLNQTFEKQEVQNVNDRFDMVEVYEKEIDQMHDDHHEKFNSVKENLEKRLQEMQISFEKTTANCLLNEKKLEYNYLILTKRQKELGQIKSEQKQKIIRLRSMVTKIHQRIEETEKAFSTNSANLQREIEQLKLDFQRNSNKTIRMNEINENLFQKIWNLNENRCIALLKKLFQINKQLYKELLYTDWTEPELKLMKPNKLPSMQLANHLLGKSNLVEDIKNEEFVDKEPLITEISLDVQLTKFILKEVVKVIELLSHHVGDLTKDLSESQQNLINYNSILKALKIQNRSEIELMNRSVVPHIKCLTCKSKNITKKKKIHLQSKRKSLPNIKRTFVINKRIELNRPSSAPQFLDKSEDGIDKNITKSICRNADHSWQIDELALINAISNFIKNMKYERETKRPSSTRMVFLHRILTKKDMDMYWEKFSTLFSEHDENSWSVVHKFLNEYSKILQEQNKLEQEMENLEKQNAELKHLLSQLPNNLKIV